MCLLSKSSWELWIWVTQTVAEGTWDKVVVKSMKIKDSTFVKNITGATDNTRKYRRIFYYKIKNETHGSRLCNSDY